jgi:hypothetical protein
MAYAQVSVDSVAVINNSLNPENIPIVNLSESDVEDNTSVQNVSSILASSRDVFQSNASFTLSQGAL